MTKTRKSSFGWGVLGSRQRQQKLEDAVQKHVVDVFFTVHAVGDDGRRLYHQSYTARTDDVF